MLLFASRENMAERNAQLDCILEGYQEFYDFDYRELHLIESLRTLRLINYSAWLAKRWEDPTFPINFPWFNTLHYWQELLQNLREQSEVLALQS
jgi:Ser/Thr protein kinase RdoA (MazF antagonist)